MNSDKEFTGLSPDEYKRIRATRLNQLITWQIIPNWLWVIIIIIGCVLLLRESSSWWIKTIGIVLVSYSSLQYGSRLWKLDDFMEGYEQGFSDGVDKLDKFLHNKKNDIS